MSNCTDPKTGKLKAGSPCWKRKQMRQQRHQQKRFSQKTKAAQDGKSSTTVFQFGGK